MKRWLPVAFAMLAACVGIPAHAQSPIVTRMKVPEYPGLALLAGLGTTVHASVTVKSGVVSGVTVLDSTGWARPFLTYTRANIRTWEFYGGKDTTFITAFHYEVTDTGGKVENPRVELDLPFQVRIRGSRPKPRSTHDSESGYSEPVVTRAEVPRYPSIALAAGLASTVRVSVTVKKGRVADLTVLDSTGSAGQFMHSTLANIRTWEFLDAVDTTFVTTFGYELTDTITEKPENPRVELKLPFQVRIIGSRSKPRTISDPRSTVVKPL